MNSMNDSGDFQDVESNYSGRLSRVSSQHATIPSSRSMLSRDKRLPLDTWNTSGLQENVFGNQFSAFDSFQFIIKEFTLAKQRERGSVPQDNSYADICRKAVDYEFVNTVGISAEFNGSTGKTANFGAAI